MKPKNMLFIVTDQLRYDALGVNGNKVCRTPALDALAGMGCRFARAYTPCGLCSPARASILTGRFPHRHGVLTNVGQDQTRPEMPQREVTFAQILTTSGYRCGYVGKWHVGVSMGPDRWGFSDRPALTEREYLGGFDTPARLESAETSSIHANRFVLAGRRSGGPMQDQTGYCETQCVDMLRSYAGQQQPFLLRVDFTSPHPPYIVPEPYASLYPARDIEPDPRWINERFEDKPHIHRLQTERWGTDSLSESQWRRVLAYYYGMVSQLDAAIGRVLDELVKLGLTGDTIVIFTSDHGDAVGSHRMFDKGYCMYEEQYHIPLMIRHPEWERSAVYEGWVSLVDLMPTVLEMAGCPLPQEPVIDGVSLLGAVRGDLAPVRDSVFAEFNGMQYGLNSIRMVRDDRHKLVLNLNDRNELYDLEQDPHEIENLSGKPSHQLTESRLYARLLGWMKATDDPLLKTIWGSAAFDPEYSPPAGTMWFAGR